jgi:hypothetical protein
MALRVTPMAAQLMRLGLASSRPQPEPERAVEYDGPVPEREAPPTLRLADLPSALIVPARPERDAPDEPDPVRRVRGQMVWLHKSVPVLEIEGHTPTSPEEMARMRRR